MTSPGASDNPTRARGRPKVNIDPDAVADAVAELFSEAHLGEGSDAISIAATAEKLGVSRATLYRTVPTKEHLLGILLQRSMRELTDEVEKALDRLTDPGDQIRELIRIQSGAAINMRAYMPLFFGGGNLPPDIVQRWRKWTRKFEKNWMDVVSACMKAGYLDHGDPLLTTRLILGSIIWVSRWYRPAERITADQIADAAITMLGLRLA